MNIFHAEHLGRFFKDHPLFLYLSVTCKKWERILDKTFGLLISSQNQFKYMMVNGLNIIWQKPTFPNMLKKFQMSCQKSCFRFLCHIVSKECVRKSKYYLCVCFLIILSRDTNQTWHCCIILCIPLSSCGDHWTGQRYVSCRG